MTGKSGGVLETDFGRVTQRDSLKAIQYIDINVRGRRYSICLLATLKAGHIFMERIPIEFNGYYQRSDYEFWEGITTSGSTALRDDDTYKVYCKIGYIFMRWFTLSIKPGYEKRNSNMVGRSYEDKTIMAQLEFQYDVGGK